MADFQYQGTLGGYKFQHGVLALCVDEFSNLIYVLGLSSLHPSLDPFMYGVSAENYQDGNDDNQIHIFSTKTHDYHGRVELNRPHSNILQISSMALGRDGECLFVASENDVYVFL